MAEQNRETQQNDRNVESNQAEVAPARRAPRQLWWWVRMMLPATLVLVAGVLVIVGLGVAQRVGWISAGAIGGAAEAEGADTEYTCAMHPQIRQNMPGRCPICAMELVPAASADAGGGDEYAVEIEPAARRVANIETVSVERQDLSRTIRAVGALTFDESRLATITPYVDGRLEKLYVDTTGEVVSKEQELALLYSPELYKAQIEYLLAKKTSAALSQSRLTRSQNNGDMTAAARQKLVELGMRPEQIAQLDHTGEALTRLKLHATLGGTVIEKPAVEGEYVKTGEPIYRIADLSQVWLELDLFPEDAAHVSEGQKVEATVKSLPGRKFTGRVDFVNPVVNQSRRTVGVRVVLPNEQRLLRPGDYATARIEVPLGGATPNVAVVPRGAVLAAGASSVVYVETEPGKFEIRRVTLGPAVGDRIVVTQGLEEGEQVAASGNFLIDSQMQLAGKPSLIDPAKAPTEPRGPLKLERLSPERIAGKAGEDLERLYAAYLEMQEALAADRTISQSQVKTLRDAAGAVAESDESDGSFRQLAQNISEHAEHLHHQDLKDARAAFKKVSRDAIRLAGRVRGAGSGPALSYYYCPMGPGGGAEWLQVDGEKVNPYMGVASGMIRCGEKVHTLAAETQAAASDTELR